MEKKGILKFMKTLLKKAEWDDSFAFAYQLTYSLLLAIFPFLIFLFTLLGYMKIDSAIILQRMQEALPMEVYDLTAGIVTDVLDNQRGGLMSLSIFLAIYTSSGGIRAFMKGMNKAMRIKEKRNIVHLYALSIFWVVLFAVSIMLSLVGIVFGEQILMVILHYFPALPQKEFIQTARIVTPVIFMFLMFTMFYMFVPTKKVKFRYAFPGALFATLMFILSTLAFQYYVNNLANYSRFYGTLGAVVALMLWLLVVSMIMLFSAQINALLIEVRGIRDPYIHVVQAVRDRVSARRNGKAANSESIVEKE